MAVHFACFIRSGEIVQFHEIWVILYEACKTSGEGMTLCENTETKIIENTFPSPTHQTVEKLSHT